MSDLIPTAQAVFEAVTDDEAAEAEELCQMLGIPAEYARNVAAALTICEPAGAV